MSVVAKPQEGPSTTEPAPAFQQRLGLFDSTMLVAGTMIGSGIFIVSADIARDVGTSGWLLAVWALTGLMTVIGALSYAELAAMMPYAGGQYVFLREAFNPLFGFLYGWTLFLVIQTGTIAAVGVAFAKFLGVWIPALGAKSIIYAIPLERLGLGELGQKVGMTTFEISAGQCVGAGIILLLTWLNCRGVQTGKTVQNLFTVAKTAALIALILIGSYIAANPEAIRINVAHASLAEMPTKAYGEIHKWLTGSSEPTTGLWHWVAMLMVVGGTMTGSLFSADAWNNVTFTAGEVKDPRRTLAWSMALGTSLVICLYLLANVAYLAVLPINGAPTGTPVFQHGIANAVEDRVGTALMESAFPVWGPCIMALAIMVSTFGCVNGLILMGARLYYAMARDGLFFQAVGRLNRQGVPATGLALQGIWSSILVFSGTYSNLLNYVIFAALMFYVLTIAGLFALRRKRPNAERPYRAFGYPVVPAIYGFLCLVIMLDLLKVRPTYTWPGLIIVLTGVPVYAFWRSLRPRTA
jgi:APA family basic amino acid/polyamine antiporter